MPEIPGARDGGCWFDRVVRSGTGEVLGPPALFLLLASLTTTAALFVPTGWMSIALLVPCMLSFGAAHLVAGPGRQAQASSLVMIGVCLVGPALGPILVGIISGTATAANMPDGLGLGLLIVPLRSALAGLAILVANQRAGDLLRK